MQLANIEYWLEKAVTLLGFIVMVLVAQAMPERWHVLETVVWLAVLFTVVRYVSRASRS